MLTPLKLLSVQQLPLPCGIHYAYNNIIRLSIKPKLVEKAVLRAGFIPARLSFQDNRATL